MNTANLIFTATYAKTGKRSGYFYELKPIDDTNNKTSNSDKYPAYKAMKLFHNDKTIKLIDNERYNIEVAINPLEIKKITPFNKANSKHPSTKAISKNTTSTCHICKKENTLSNSKNLESRFLKDTQDNTVSDSNFSSSLDTYIQHIETVDLSSQVKDYSNTNIFHQLSNILNLIDDTRDISAALQKHITTLRNKITIDGTPLNTFISNEILFERDTQDIELQVSEILNIKNHSGVIDRVIRAFTPLDPDKLRYAIFKTRKLRHKEILERIDFSSRIFYTPYQTIFHLLYKKYFNYSLQIVKLPFDKYWNKENDFNKDKLATYYIEFLTLAQKLNLSHILKDYKFIGWTFKHCIDKKWAIPAENLPIWLENWVQEESEQRNLFIKKLGFHTADSPIVTFRKALIDPNTNPKRKQKLYQLCKPLQKVLWNTIAWLSQFDTDIITNNIHLIKQIESQRPLVSDQRKLVIPLIDHIDEENKYIYKLEETSRHETLYVLPENLEYTADLYSIIKEQMGTIKITDHFCDKYTSYFKKEVIEVHKLIDLEDLTKNSTSWSAPFYQTWIYKIKYPIYIYQGDKIPHKLVYKNVILKKQSYGSQVYIDGKYFITNRLKHSILGNIKHYLPKDALDDLKEWHYKTLKDPSLLDYLFFKSDYIIEKLIKERLGFSLDQQKSSKLRPFCQAIYHLSNLGYDLKRLNREGALLTNIITITGSKIKCLVQCAKEETLQLSPEYWHLLSSPNTTLLVVFPQNRSRLFTSQEDLLKDSLFKHIQVIIPKPNTPEEMNELLEKVKFRKKIILKPN